MIFGINGSLNLFKAKKMEIISIHIMVDGNADKNKSINQLISKISILSSFLKIVTHTSSGKIYPLYTIIIPFIFEPGFQVGPPNPWLLVKV